MRRFFFFFFSPWKNNPQNRYTFSNREASFRSKRKDSRNNAIAVGVLLFLAWHFVLYFLTHSKRSSRHKRGLTASSRVAPLSLCPPTIDTNKMGGIQEEQRSAQAVQGGSGVSSSCEALGQAHKARRAACLPSTPDRPPSFLLPAHGDHTEPTLSGTTDLIDTPTLI